MSTSAMSTSAGQTWAVVLAAGAGTRLARAGLGVSKQFLTWRGRPLYWHSVRTFGRVAGVRGVVLVFPGEGAEARIEDAARLFAAEGPALDWRACAGGERRQDSVANALGQLPKDCTRVLVHDAARPFAAAGITAALLAALDAGARACVPAVPIADTVKRVADAVVVETLERSELMAVQTPQGFDLELLRAAHRRAEAEGWAVTDDASMVERMGEPVAVVPGREDNVKITTPADLDLLASGGVNGGVTVTGWGMDVHRFAAADDPLARPMRLGGVPVPGGPGVLAHSDGDVLLHALTDAVLGAAGLGDIGRHFPDTDPEYDNADSAVLAKRALLMAAETGVTPLHADCTVIAQAPRLAPHADAIRKNLAGLLELPAARVNVKATTEEGLGFTGRKEGIKAVVALTARLDAARLDDGRGEGA